ncbi:MAG: hypothetical protein JXA22_08055 [Candidatus Thermoplasmatota archaeon]|nr:hypothetical protein [Candidatus Thermoplasmatota archaeon]
MADTKMVRMLDAKLIEEGILSKDFKNDYSTVHDMLNSYMRRSGGKLPDEIFKIGEKKLRDWLMILYKQGASQEKLTSYLRCGLAHLSFDYIASQNPRITTGDLVTRSLQSFKLRKYNKSFFRVSRLKEKTTISLKKK